MPCRYKLCSFNCVYCHYGWTKEHTADVLPFAKDLPDIDDVIKVLRQALVSEEQFDYVTFSGNGEPTLYPHFAELVAEIGRLRDEYRPGIKIALLSNSTGLRSGAVRKSVASIDLPVFKLDAGTRKTFNAINRPAPGIDFDEIIANLRALRGIFIQTVLVHGLPNNTAETELDAYYGKISMIHPAGVHIYSIDRPVPNTRLTRVEPDELKKIVGCGREKTGLNMQAYYMN